MSPTKQFLLIRNRRTDTLETIDFGSDSAAAVAEYTSQEVAHRGQPDVEVLLVGSDSLETVRKTHSTWFPDYVRPTLKDILARMDRTPEPEAHPA
ncbi:hypothetical protein [Brevibacterium samyangense]|uniref:Uncharacterized protein n=1 Tax=Brevibacterium samyangense TaxID=366888 RepID=A0ABN2T4B3_9MICO